ncbi:MAG: leucyl aminopeptidase, partial [Firmicutes bacterium]|nr:leucyl aminopeptidase [Bacillota bacterium]
MRAYFTLTNEPRSVVHVTSENTDIVLPTTTGSDGKRIATAFAKKEFEGKFLQVWDTLTLGALSAHRLVLIGLGKRADFSSERLRDVSGQLAQLAPKFKAQSMAWSLPSTDFSLTDAVAATVEGLELGFWKFPGYHQEPVHAPELSVDIVGIAEQDMPGAQAARVFAQAVASAQNFTRELGWRPSSELYPAALAEAALNAGAQHGFSVEVFDEAKLKELGMGALLGVGQGSEHPPRMVVMQYQGGGDHTLALVGKGITFDSGGISIKPGAHMDEMKYDMLGAGAVLGAMCAIADTKPAINVLAVLSIAQNMPSGSAYKPGDVVRAFNGKTIEILNTDAEGRVVLSDGVSYAAHLHPDWIVETSTLTGAAIVSLGHLASALIATDDALAQAIERASHAVGER